MKSGKGKYRGENDLIDLENEDKVSNIENGESGLSTRQIDSNPVRAESGLRGNDERSMTCPTGTRLTHDQNVPIISDETSQQNVLLAQMFQQQKYHQEYQVQLQLEGNAQIIQMLKAILKERAVSHIPSPLPENRRVSFDQNAPTVYEGDSRNEGNRTGYGNERLVNLATNRNVGNDQMGNQPIFNVESENDLRLREAGHPFGGVGHEGTGKGNKKGNENNEDSESGSSDGDGANTSDGSDENAHMWQVQPSRRGKRKRKRETKYVVFSDPFLSITKFDSKKLAPPFREWYNTEYHPVALQVGLDNKESCKRMRSHLDYAAKQAYDLAVEQYGFDLVQVCHYMHTRFKATEKLTMAALHARKMNGTESVTEYALKLETMYGTINPTASAKRRERDLAPIFRHGIPKGLLDECNMFPYPQTLTETLEQVKHREGRWKEKQASTSERSVNVRNVQTPAAYTAPGSNNNWFQTTTKV